MKDFETNHPALHVGQWLVECGCPVFDDGFLASSVVNRPWKVRRASSYANLLYTSVARYSSRQLVTAVATI